MFVGCTITVGLKLKRDLFLEYISDAQIKILL